MAKKPNVTCATCEKPMVSARPQGVAKCLPCRRRAHGTITGYRRGCRCHECRAANARVMLEYTRRRTERDGVSQYATYAMRRAEAEGRVYVPEAERMEPCAVCGDEVLKRDPSSPVPAMHRACKEIGRAHV